MDKKSLAFARLFLFYVEISNRGIHFFYSLKMIAVNPKCNKTTSQLKWFKS